MEKKRLHAIYITAISVLGVTALSLGAALIATNLPESPKSAMQHYYDNKVAAFGVENSNFSKGQIVFIGDSITDLYPLGDYYSDLDLMTYNRGIGGDTTKGVLKRMDVSLYAIQPTKVVLMIGINDINGGVPFKETSNNYKAILDGIKTNLPNTVTYCMSILPMSDKILEVAQVDILGQNQKVREMNEEIKPIIADHGYTYLDLYSLVQDENQKLRNELTDDGIHLNSNGFAIWTNLVKPYLM